MGASQKQHPLPSLCHKPGKCICILKGSISHSLLIWNVNHALVQHCTLCLFPAIAGHACKRANAAHGCAMNLDATTIRNRPLGKGQHQGQQGTVSETRCYHGCTIIRMSVTVHQPACQL